MQDGQIFHQIELPSYGQHPQQREMEEGHPQIKQSWLIGLLSAFYLRWAKFVVGHRNAIIIVCSLLSTLGTIKIFNTPFVNDINGFTPYGARALAESSIRDQFFNASEEGGNFGVFLLVMPKKPGENMLGRKMLEEVMKVDDVVNWNITLQNHAANKSATFAEFCRAFCNINEPVRLFLEGLKMEHEMEEGELSLNYPTINVLGRKMNIQPYFHGIQFVASPPNAPNPPSSSSNMAFVGMIALIYKGERDVAHELMASDADVKEYELKVTKFFQSQFQSDHVRVLSISASYVEAEFVRASLSMLPFLGIGFMIMLICTSISIPLSAAYFQQATRHKEVLAIVSCLCPFMATGTALGLLFLLHVRFSPILCATPFLVLAIGVDDAYLMAHAWNRLAKKCQFLVPSRQGHPTAPKEAQKEDERVVSQLLATVLMDTGPAILVSALANICSDAIGAFIGSPEITLLCVGNATALAFDFFFQCTYFVAILATVGLAERREMRGKKIVDNKIHDMGNAETARKIEQGGGKTWQMYFHDRTKPFVAKFVTFYVDAISNLAVALLIAICSAIFIAFSIISITKFEVNMTTRELYSSDSPLLEIDNIRENRINPFYTQATVFINNIGNLTNKLPEINALVSEFEHLPTSWGPQSTMLFLRDFDEYYLGKNADAVGGDEIGTFLGQEKTNLSSSGFDCGQIDDFLAQPEYSHWRGFIRLNEGSKNGSENGTSACAIEQFFFTTAYHDPKLNKWSERVEMLKKWRKIVDERGNGLGATVYHEEGIYLDLMDNMPTDTWQSALATLACMAIICLLMLHDLRTVLVTTIVISAIIIETLGILSWTGVALNQLMMGSLIISIGFSVDLPAHFSYHYLTSNQISAKSKLKGAIQSVGLPGIQASLSTTLYVLISHYWIQLYIAQIFVRIICLTIFLCLLNTLVILPALLRLINIQNHY